MSGEPSSACRRSARLAAKRAEVTRADDEGATPSGPAIDADAFASTSGCQSTVKKRNVTCKSTRVAQPAKKLKTVQEDEVGENTRTKGQNLSQRVSRRLEDVEEPKIGRKKTTLAEISPNHEKAVATKPPATTKIQRARTELTSSEPSRQAKRIRGRSRSTSRSSEATERVASSGGSHTAEEIASNTGSTTPEQVDETLPTPPVVEVETKFDRLRRV